MRQPESRLWRRVRVVLVASDVAGILVGLGLAATPSFSAGTGPQIALQLLAVAIAWELAFMAAGLYRRCNVVSGIAEYRRVVSASTMTVLAAIVVTDVAGRLAVPRHLLLLAWGTVPLVVGTGRFIIRRIVYRAARRGERLERVVVVGTSRHAVAAATELNESPSASTEVVGFLSDDQPIGTVISGDLRVVGEPLQLAQVCARLRVTRALVVGSALSWESLRAMVQQMHGPGDIQIALIPGLFDLHATAMVVQQLGPVLTLVPQPARIVGGEALLKRGFDLVVSLVVLLLSFPVIAALALRSLLVRGDLGIGVERMVGPGGEFVLWSFTRSNWARRAHIARFPSLVLVFTGRMSLLGPRPIPADRAAEHAWAMSHLHAAKPGFIGPWWLLGRTRPTTIEDELACDLHYLRNYSIWFDLSILVRVVRTFLHTTARPAVALPITSRVRGLDDRPPLDSPVREGQR